MRKIYLIFCLLLIAFANGIASPLQKQIELLLQDSATTLSSVATISFTNGTSSNYFASEDITIPPDTGASPQLYSFTFDNVACGYNSYGNFNNTLVLPLGVNIVAGGTFTFSSQRYTNFDPASMLFLEDRLLHVFIDLRQTSYKIVISQPGQITGRFFLHVTYPPVASSGASGCSNNDGVVNVVEDNSVVWDDVKIYDSLSVLVAIDTNVTGNFSFNGLPGGNYRVEFDYGLYAPIQYVEVEEHQLISGLNVASNHGTVFQNMQFYTANSNANQFQWDFGDGSTITGVANPTYAYLNPGTFTVRVNCSNAYGCTGSADTVVYIDEASSIDKIDGNSIVIITDSKSVRIELDNASSANYRYEVYNIEGQLIKTGPINSSEVTLNFLNDATGVYIVSIKGESSVLSKKVIITH